MSIVAKLSGSTSTDILVHFPKLSASASTGIHFPKLSGRNNIEIAFMYSQCGGDWKKVSRLFFVANFELFVICLKTETTIKRHFLFLSKMIFCTLFQNWITS